MAQRIFIKVIGFSKEERQALDTVFRLSEQCRTMYRLWSPQAPEPPRLALLDGQSPEARLDAESASLADLPVFWFGPHPPAGARRSFERPIAWPEVVAMLDAVFAAEASDLDLNLDGGADVDLDLNLDLAAVAGGDSALSIKQALIVSAQREDRLYLRARLALARLVLADEADTGVQAVELARDRQYDVAFVDAGLPDVDAWALVKHLRQGRHPIPHVAMTRVPRSLPQRVRAWFGGPDALLDHPPHPGRLKAWLSRI